VESFSSRVLVAGTVSVWWFVSPALPPMWFMQALPLPRTDVDNAFGGREGLGGTGRGGGGLEAPSGFPWDSFLVGEVEEGGDEVDEVDRLVCILGRDGGRGEFLGECASSGEDSLSPLLCLTEIGG